MNDYVPSLCPQIPKIGKEFEKFYSYRIRNIHTRSKIIVNHLYLGIKYSFIYTEYELFKPHSKLKNSCWFRKKYPYRIIFYSYRILFYSYRIWIYLFAVDCPKDLFVPDPKIWKWSWLTDWFRKNKKLRVWIPLKE